MIVDDVPDESPEDIEFSHDCFRQWSDEADEKEVQQSTEFLNDFKDAQ